MKFLIRVDIYARQEGLLSFNSDYMVWYRRKTKMFVDPKNANTATLVFISFIIFNFNLIFNMDNLQKCKANYTTLTLRCNLVAILYHAFWKRLQRISTSLLANDNWPLWFMLSRGQHSFSSVSWNWVKCSLWFVMVLFCSSYLTWEQPHLDFSLFQITAD